MWSPRKNRVPVCWEETLWVDSLCPSSLFTSGAIKSSSFLWNLITPIPIHTYPVSCPHMSLSPAKRPHCADGVLSQESSTHTLNFLTQLLDCSEGSLHLLRFTGTHPLSTLLPQLSCHGKEHLFSQYPPNRRAWSWARYPLVLPATAFNPCHPCSGNAAPLWDPYQPVTQPPPSRRPCWWSHSRATPSDPSCTLQRSGSWLSGSSTSPSMAFSWISP